METGYLDAKLKYIKEEMFTSLDASNYSIYRLRLEELTCISRFDLSQRAIIFLISWICSL